jgi:hypothetical protein
MTATVTELADEGEFRHYYPEDLQEIWPAELPPPLEEVGDEELGKLETLEERILHKYTPSKLAINSLSAPPRVPDTKSGAVGKEAQSNNSTVKACPACMGVGKVGTLICMAGVPVSRMHPCKYTQSYHYAITDAPAGPSFSHFLDGTTVSGMWITQANSASGNLSSNIKRALNKGLLAAVVNARHDTSVQAPVDRLHMHTSKSDLRVSYRVLYNNFNLL